MLSHLHIKNAALIKDCHMDFVNGLTILTGETGAGKSMVFGSLYFVLGSRATREFVKKGASEAVVEALFVTQRQEVRQRLLEAGIALEEDGSVLLTRTYTQEGKSIARVNGSLVTLSILKQIGEGLVDVYGQHEHQSLLQVGKHIQLLDSFCKNKIQQHKQKLRDAFQQYKEIQKEALSLSGGEKDRQGKLEYLQFQLEELDQANLQPEEETLLLEKKGRLLNSEKIKRFLGQAQEALFEGRQGDSGALDGLSTAVSSLEMLSELDNGVGTLYADLESAYTQCLEVGRELSQYASKIEWEPEELEEIEERLALIHRLKRKYGGSLEAVLDQFEKMKQEWEWMSQGEEMLHKLSIKKTELLEQMKKICGDISQIRKETGELVEQEVEKQLMELDMKSARFSVGIEQNKEMTPNGWDRVEFYISTNGGEEVKPLSKIASGGEMSRVMLAVKSVLADSEEVETFLFDEIDTGVSGRAAQRVGEKMWRIGKEKQILCITHLPQIAALSDSHYLVEKRDTGNDTASYAMLLDQGQKEEEIARLLGGANVTNMTKQAAEEMLNIAKRWKGATEESAASE